MPKVKNDQGSHNPTGEYKLVGNRLQPKEKGLPSFRLCTRKNPDLKKPRNYLMVVKDGKQSYYSSMYPLDAEGMQYRVEYAGEYWVVTATDAVTYTITAEQEDDV